MSVGMLVSSIDKAVSAAEDAAQRRHGLAPAGARALHARLAVVVAWQVEQLALLALKLQVVAAEVAHLFCCIIISSSCARVEVGRCGGCHAECVGERGSSGRRRRPETAARPLPPSSVHSHPRVLPHPDRGPTASLPSGPHPNRRVLLAEHRHLACLIVVGHALARAGHAWWGGWRSG